MAKEAFRIRLGEGESDQACSSDRADLETLSLVVSRASNAILIMDAAGKIEWTNDAFTNLTGYPPSEALGESVDHLVFGPSTSAKSKGEFLRAISSGCELTTDILQYRKDGTTHWVESKLIPVHDDRSDVSRWILIQSDISKRRRTEEALRAAKQAAESSSRSKSEFLANMSHEIRTPLNAILGMTELALSTELTREQSDYLRTVKTSADALLDLLNDVLDISKIEAGKLEIEEVDFDLAEVVRETVKALAVRAHEKGLELAVHMPMNIPHDLRGDPTRIRQILFNLIGNAIKFTEKGEVIISVEPQWQADDEIELHFSVSDTGIGIPKDRLKKIFESFTQVDSSMTRRYGGSGLGLTITAQLLDLMDGKIWVQSTEGEGSTFHFTITLKISSRESKSTRPLKREKLVGRRVLIVDDNATNRKILDEMMSHWGLKTTLCDGAASALGELEAAVREKAPFDLILLDAMMPVVDGFQLAEMIRQRPDLYAGTVMMLSSADRPNSTARCKKLGIATYLVKPVSASALLEAVLHLLGDVDPKATDPTLGVAHDHDGGDRLNRKADKPLHVLLVDDHAPNRKLVESILHRRGHSCQSEEDGDAAIRACRESTFDVVLMDVQMPGRNGFSATRAIREHEKSTGLHLPIVALTAHALKGDREKCLAAGMDAYLAKPIHAGELIELVETIGHGNVPFEGTTTSRIVSTPQSEFNIQAALKRMGGEMDLLREHMGYALSDMPQLMAAMHQALEHEDSQQVAIAAHRLKSLVSSYDHTEATELTQRIETHAKSKNLNEVEFDIKRLDPLVQSLARAVDDFLQTQ